MKQRILTIIIVAITNSCIWADSVSNIIAKSGSGKTRPDFSICFVNIEDGKVIYENNSHKSLKPASNAKLMTTAAALHYLGADFEYITRYGLLGDNLVIIGSGDPLTGDPVIAQREGKDINDVFAGVLAGLRARGITEIKGDLLVDNYIFDDDRFHSSWPESQANRWYQAQISGLSFNNNCVDIEFSASTNGRVAGYRLIPQTSYLTIINNCKAISSGTTTVGATRKINTNEVTLIGKFNKPLAEPINVTVDRPGAFHGFVLAEYLLANGIQIKGALHESRVTSSAYQIPADFEEIYSEKHTLIETINESNRRSLNMVAESVLKTVAAYVVNGQSHSTPQRPGSWADGTAAIADFLIQAGIPQNEFIIDDGCGLSHSNRMSAAAMCKLLVYMAQRPEFEVYRNSFSTPETGTLAKRGRFGKLEGRIYAKTGYISGANTLSGYCLNSNNQWIAFSVLTNSPA
ncbi:MAG: D-alanyl-D-alanine carboxypeptidase/D-alanyl-D-alanine-endopeptidase, partial [Sedimentisphaerales bacterium]|nr:D-alanyl-D-alanine carboxypeptidase/D-alanyl-D-alanine-endopeptidase [Sedimentisphaerales bacterium]